MAGEAPEPKPGQPKQSFPGQLWSDTETHHLIEAYEERWYSLKRGPLKVQQWEDVAGSLAIRCGFDEPSKTGTQCRHKMEKLRKRYRADKQRPFPSRWIHFDRMDQMERGPIPISVRSMLTDPRHKTQGGGGRDSGSGSDGDGDGDENEEEQEEINNTTRSLNGILREEGWRYPRVSRNRRSREEERDGGRGPINELASAVRRFGDGFMRMEKRRLELMREMERDRLEMVSKTAEMVMESERCLMDTIARAVYSVKKPKKSEEM